MAFLLQCYNHCQLQLPLSSGGLAPEQVAPAYSKLLHQLSEIIAAAIRADQADANSAT